jgi:uncharacterized protein YecE (DUF72 family)
MPFDREFVRERIGHLAGRGVYLGTSSWKYPGWAGQLYSPERYAYRGKFAKTRFERDCLAEYAEVFKTVSVDAAYYDFPRREFLEKLAAQVPDDFRFAIKVTDAITLKRFPNLPRFGVRAGTRNEHFLNADLFEKAFLGPCESIRKNIGVIMFEFSRFWPPDYEHGRDFVADLDAFLARLPKGWPYAIEMRNKAWLHDAYFQCLATHGVTHLFNSWEAMPPVNEQMALPGSRTNPDLVVARCLLKPGRKFEEAVKMFQPYERTHEINDGVRQAVADLVIEGERFEPRRKTYIYINNRLEGNSLATLDAILRILLERQL